MLQVLCRWCYLSQPPGQPPLPVYLLLISASARGYVTGICFRLRYLEDETSITHCSVISHWLYVMEDSSQSLCCLTTSVHHIALICWCIVELSASRCDDACVMVAVVERWNVSTRLRLSGSCT